MKLLKQAFFFDVDGSIFKPYDHAHNLLVSDAETLRARWYTEE